MRSKQTTSQLALEINFDTDIDAGNNDDMQVEPVFHATVVLKEVCICEFSYGTFGCVEHRRIDAKIVDASFLPSFGIPIGMTNALQLGLERIQIVLEYGRKSQSFELDIVDKVEVILLNNGTYQYDLLQDDQ